jgi:anti-sigma factor RsiW
MPDLHLLTGAYALDALDDVERAGYERHLRTCPECSAEVIEFQEAAASLAGRVARPAPDALRARVLAEISRTRQVSPAARASWPRPSLRQSLAAAAAAVLIAGSAGLGGVAWQSHRAEHDARISAEQATRRATQLARVMTDPGRIEVVGTASVGGTATVMAAGGTAVFAASQLPAPPSGKTYQVWLIDKSGVRSAGLLKLSGGSGQSVVSGVTLGSSVAVSLEPAGGSKQPTTKPVLNLKVA